MVQETYRKHPRPSAFERVRNDVCRAILKKLEPMIEPPGRPWLYKLRAASGMKIESDEVEQLRDGDLFHWSDNRLFLLAERLGVGLQVQVAA